MKLNEIQDLIKFVSKSGVSEVELETKEIKLVIKTPKSGSVQAAQAYYAAPAVAAPVPAAVIAPPAPATAPASEARTAPPPSSNGNDESKYVTIKSPMIGTFYRSAGPDKPTFVNVGDEVSVGKAVCIIEAMKLFNEIESDVKGKIVKVLVNDATPVEYDQPLFLVDPS
ncbi:MAG TPA: acetyl-CoA carboxylase biotin carboxyl carrier protein [Bacteroidia bacterium]|nr:acetyl-CoA carboxylase biotin carboxyl carrier protein [Bacteroidia bacterium]